MQTKHLCVLIHIWTKGEVGAPSNRFQPSSNFFTAAQRRCFFCGSFMLFLSCFYAFMHVCLLMPCGHLLGKGWPIGSRLWCLIVTLSLCNWYPGPGVVLDCINSWSCPLFYFEFNFTRIFDSIYKCNLKIKIHFTKIFEYSRPLWDLRYWQNLTEIRVQPPIPNVSSLLKFVIRRINCDTPIDNFRIRRHARTQEALLEGVQLWRCFV